MKKLRVIFFLLILFGLSFVTTLSIQHPTQPPFTYSLSILFQELGKPIKSVDRAISCMLPIEEIDEKMLGDEIGHIERGHLFDAARGEMLLRKIIGDSHAFYASELLRLMLNLAFSKSQEDEADEYSFRLLMKKQYNPFAMSDVFNKLSSSHIHDVQSTSPIDDFLATHPYTELRVEKFYSRAQAWIANHPREKWYSGEKNFAHRITHSEKDYPDEWRF